MNRKPPRYRRTTLPPDDDKILARLARVTVSDSMPMNIEHPYGNMKREQEKLPSYPPGSNPSVDRILARDRERDQRWDRYMRHCSALGVSVIGLLLGERDDVPAALKELAKFAGKAIRAREKYLKR